MAHAQGQMGPVRLGARGLLVDGRYRLEELLGAGGFGEVWRASQEVEGSQVRPVALKLLWAMPGAGPTPLGSGPGSGSGSSGTSGAGAGSGRASTTGDGGDGHRWLDEVRAVRGVRCGSIVTIYDVGIAREPRVAFIAMELLHGETLAARLKIGPIYWRRVLAIAREVARALETCHAVGVIHCDLKPHNVFLGAGGLVHVLDFGVATLAGHGRREALRGAPVMALADGSGDADFAATGAVSVDEIPGVGAANLGGPLLGTPGYIAPELFHGDEATPASDVFALGVVIYEAIAGRLPHRVAADVAAPDHSSGRAHVERFRAALNTASVRGDMVPLAEVCPEAPPALCTLIDRLLSVEPDKRPARDISAALDEVWHRPWGVPDPPYVGLAALDARRAGYIAGRDADIEDIARSLGQHRSVVLSGPSGCGKSSLATAGVAARIDQELLDKADGWRLVTLRPSEGAAVLRQADAGAGASPSPSPSPSNAAGSGIGTVVVVDQLEEVLQLPAADRVAFCAALADLALGEGAVAVRGEVFAADQPVRVVATVRDDLFGRVAALPELRRVPERNLYTVRGVEPNAMADIALGPARAAGYRLEDGDAVVAEAVRILASDPGALPLVQFALTRWWEERDLVGKILPQRAWASFGGIEGALAEAAQALHDGLTAAERTAMRTLLIALFRPDGTRVRIAEQAVAPDDTARSVLARLVERRLVTRHDDGDAAVTLEVVHEALGRRWPLLHTWLEETRSERELIHDAAADAARWQRSGRPADLLWRGARLVAAQRLGARLGEARGFIAAARDVEGRARWIRRAVFGVLAGLAAIIVVVVLSYLGSNRERAEAQTALADLEQQQKQTEIARAEAETARAAADGLRADAESARGRAEEETRAAEQAKQQTEEALTANTALLEQTRLAEAEAQSARSKAEDAVRQLEEQKELVQQTAARAEAQRREAEKQRIYAENAQKMHEVSRKRMEQIEAHLATVEKERDQLLRRLEQDRSGSGRKKDEP